MKRKEEPNELYSPKEPNQPLPNPLVNPKCSCDPPPVIKRNKTLVK